MFQPNVFSKACSEDRSARKRSAKRQAKLNPIKQTTNSTLLAEAEESTANVLGQLSSRGGKYTSLERGLNFRKGLIHRVSSAEESTATVLGILTLDNRSKKINRKNAPDDLSLNFRKQGDETMERTS